MFTCTVPPEIVAVLLEFNVKVPMLNVPPETDNVPGEVIVRFDAKFIIAVVPLMRSVGENVPAVWVML